jgi:hypothetical protein
LLQAVWGDTFVEEGNLKQYISHLRKALGDNSEDTRVIVTIARKGYQFTVDVTAAEAADTAKHAAVQVPTAKSPLADTQTIFEPSGKRDGPESTLALVETCGRRRICLNFDGRRLYVFAALSGYSTGTIR